MQPAAVQCVVVPASVLCDHSGSSDQHTMHDGFVLHAFCCRAQGCALPLLKHFECMLSPSQQPSRCSKATSVECKELVQGLRCVCLVYTPSHVAFKGKLGHAGQGCLLLHSGACGCEPSVGDIMIQQHVVPQRQVHLHAVGVNAVLGADEDQLDLQPWLPSGSCHPGNVHKGGCSRFASCLGGGWQPEFMHDDLSCIDASCCSG